MAEPAVAPGGGWISARLRDVLQGDPSARSWLYETFSPRLYRRLRARYGSRAGFDPEEILHDTFVSLFQHARVIENFLDEPPALQTAPRFEVFLWNHACGVASNRRRSMRRRGAEPWPEQEPESFRADPERETVGRDVLARLAHCLKSNGTRIYLYYKLRYVDGLTPAEIVNVTGWSRKVTYRLKLALDEAVMRCARRLGLL
jgi:DNA-directed RNA polymerase specialized sigma24 family protein